MLENSLRDWQRGAPSQSGTRRANSVWVVAIGEPLIGLKERRSPIRAGQLSLALREVGWDVTWWTSTFDHLRKQQYDAQERAGAELAGVRMAWLRGCGYRRNVSLSRGLNHLQLALHFIRECDRHPVPDVICLSFPPIELAAAVAYYARRRGVPLVFDVRDLWPDVFEWAAYPAVRGFIRVLAWPLNVATNFALRAANAIVGVSAGYVAWGQLRRGGPPVSWIR